MPVMCEHPGRDCLDLECPCCCLRCAEDHHEIRYRQRHGWRRGFRAGELGEEYIPSAEDLKWARRELGGEKIRRCVRGTGLLLLIAAGTVWACNGVWVYAATCWLLAAAWSSLEWAGRSR